MPIKNKNSKKYFAQMLLCIGLSTLAACRSLPPVEMPEHAAASAQKVAVEERDRGPIEQRSLRQLAIDIGDLSPELRHHLQAIAAQPGPPLIDNNQAQLLVDGPAAYQAMFAAIASAKNHINVEAYIVDNDALGNKLADLLMQKRKAGVQVNLIYDSVGSVATSAAWFETLRSAGIRVFAFHPLTSDKLLSLNQRDHRKLLIVDGSVGFTGGINISGVYSRGSHSAKGSAPSAGSGAAADKNAGWRDTQIEVRGPAVAELQKVFLETWNLQDEAERAPQPGLTPNYFPPLRPQGDKFLRVLASSPQQADNQIYSNLLTAIRESQHSVHLTMAYFSPDRQTILALKQAAARGVDVTLILPGFSDIDLIFAAGRSHYSELLEAGVKIYERHDALLHAKTAVIDGLWSTVGSSNMDMRSFLHNNEVNVIVLGGEFGAAMEAMFQRDIEAADVVLLPQWRQRSLWQRCRETVGRLFAYWL